MGGTTPSFLQNVVVDSLTVSGYFFGGWLTASGGLAYQTLGATPGFSLPPLLPTDDSNGKMSTGVYHTSAVSGTAVGYNNVRITNIIINSAQRGGFLSLNNSQYGGGGQGYYFNHILVDHMQVNSVHGDASDGATVSGNSCELTYCENAVIQNSVFHDSAAGNSSGAGGGNVGGFLYMCQNSVIQNCEAYNIHTSASHDACGFDLDGGCDHCAVQYCYSHDNDGAGYNVGDFVSSDSVDRSTHFAIVRYCIGQNNANTHDNEFHFFGNPDGALYNNTIYAGNATSNGSKSTSDYCGSHILLMNNIFWLGTAVSVANPSGNSAFYMQGNVYWSDSGAVTGLPGNAYDSSAIGTSVNPLLAGSIPVSSSAHLGALTAYNLQATSPCVDAGMDMSLQSDQFYSTNAPYFSPGAGLGNLDFNRNSFGIFPVGAVSYPVGGYVTAGGTTIIIKRKVQ